MTARTIPLKQPLDDAGLPRRESAAEPTLEPSKASADVARYHHPHFVRREPGQKGWATFFFTPFVGNESEPALPTAVYSDQAVTSEQRTELREQYDAARIMWSKARLRLQARPLLQQAAPLWLEAATARIELHGVFRQFWEIEDGRWRAQLLRLTDAERAASTAAAAWDEIATQLARVAHDQVSMAGEWDELELTTVAREIGLDASDWLIGSVCDYKRTPYGGDTPLVEEVKRDIQTQRERLQEVMSLAGTLRAT